jgi:Ca2+-binding RTX toxin-like protein
MASFVGSNLADTITPALVQLGIGTIAGAPGAANDQIFGNDGADMLGGGGGNDTIAGGAQGDTLAGGAGNDSLIGGNGADSLYDGAGANTFEGGVGADTMRLDTAVNDALDIVTYARSAAGVRVQLDELGNATGVGGEAQGDVLIGAFGLVGSSFADTLTGNDVNGLAGADRISGLSGASTLRGGNGNDTLRGEGGNDTLLGEVGNDRLVGGAGADTMQGGLGADTLDASLDDDGGRDVVSYAASANSVRVLLDAAGNATGIGGDAQGDVLIGVDALVGSGFADTLAGRDLAGGAGADSLLGTALADTLVGGQGADTLNGGLGDDSMTGGAGNDVFIVNGNDTLSEAPGGGIDTVRVSTGNWTLAAEFENLVLTGSASLAGTGNAVANSITGNGAANLLNGFNGADTLIGGAGADTLVGGAVGDSMIGGADNDIFAYTTFTQGGDTIGGYVNAEDAIAVSAFGFGGGLVANTVLAATAFATNITGQADDADDRFIWQSNTQTLWYDVDGLGGTGAVAIATFTGAVTLTASEILIFT